MNNEVLSLENITKSYKIGGNNQIDILKNVSLNISSGQLIGLIGPSGSGKSSLLHIAGLLDTPSSGKISIMGKDYSKSSENQRTKARNRHIGFIYQFHHLLADFTAVENVMMPQIIAGTCAKLARIKSLELLEKVGVSHRVNHLPGELSGGEQQRVAIVRALANNPQLLLADEPTGNLDQQSCGIIFDLLVSQIKSHNLASLIVTHNIEIAKKTDICYYIKDGRLEELS